MIPVTFLDERELAKNTWQFLFAKPKNFAFQAGQFTTLFLGTDNRDFTICANPFDKNYFSIVTKKGISDFKKNLFSLPKKSAVMMTKPAGGFILKNDATPKVFLAGGIGITPFYSMIQEIISQKKNSDVILFASFSKKEDMFFYNELSHLQNKNIHVVYTLSQDDWHGEKGRISEKLLKKYIDDFHAKEYLIAGSEKMVEDMQELLSKMEISEEKIRVDIFTNY